MRIALCANGRSPHTQRWANAVCDRGHDVALVWMKSDYASRQLSSFRAPITHHVVSPPKLKRPWTLPLARREYRRMVATLQPDLAHGLYLTGYGWIAKDLGVHPLVLSALGSDVLDLDPRRQTGVAAGRLYTKYVARRTHSAVACADVVLTDSVSLAATLAERVPGTDVRIIRFGVEISDVPTEARTRWRERLRIDDSAFVLLSSRLVRPNYNIDTIIRALPVIRRNCPGAVLVLKELPSHSDSEYRRACLQLAAELGVGDAIRVVGELDRSELLELHAAADVFVSVPSTDGTAVSVLEAMAAGVPVVATDAPGIDPLILADQESAVLVPVREVDALAAAVTDLGLSRPRRMQLAKRGLEVVQRHGDFDRELDRAVSLYEELVAASAAQKT
jgi:L-malate glycosyltransferase